MPFVRAMNSLEDMGLFWQYPARTEQAFASMQAPDAPCLAFPWATVIDKRIDVGSLLMYLQELCRRNEPSYTCCQHIYWKSLTPLWKKLGIRMVYIPHKMAGENFVRGIRLLPCALYAVNVEDPRFSIGGGTTARDLLYSLVGAYASHYISTVRLHIFEMKHPGDAVVKNIGNWHLKNVVYSKYQNKTGTIADDGQLQARTREYNTVLARSHFSLCPSGAGPNSIRFWESLATGAIPVLLSDGMCLPDDDGWDECVVSIAERDACKVEARLRAIDSKKREQMRVKGYEMYKKHGLRLLT